MTKKKTDPKLQAWITARTRHRLSHAHVQMARELGMNPAKLGGLDNHRQEPWKLPLPDLYEERFGKKRPDVVMTIEDRGRAANAKDAERKARKQARKAERAAGATCPSQSPALAAGRTEESTPPRR
jgi:hypothetical protein